MKNLYLYGYSDDLAELESDCGIEAEAYVAIVINGVRFDYHYDGDWRIDVPVSTPPAWIVRKIVGTSDFVHIQVPDDEDVTFIEVMGGEDE